MDRTEYNRIALGVMKVCQEKAQVVYNTCMKDNVGLFPGAPPNQTHYHCLKQKHMTETFCLHYEKEKAGITSSGFKE